MKCNNCENDATLRHVSGMSGSAWLEGKLPLCDRHFARELFEMAGAEGPVGVGGDVYYAPVTILPDFSGERLWVPVAQTSLGGESTVTEHLDGGAKALETAVDDIQEDLFVDGEKYDGGAVGFVKVDADHGSIEGHAPLAKNDRQEA